MVRGPSAEGAEVGGGVVLLLIWSHDVVLRMWVGKMNYGDFLSTVPFSCPFIWK